MDEPTPLRTATHRAHEYVAELADGTRFTREEDFAVVAYDGEDSEGEDEALVTVPGIFAPEITREATRIANLTDGVTFETVDDVDGYDHHDADGHTIRFKPA